MALKGERQLGFFEVSREVMVLINRIKDGNAKIWERWLLIRGMPEGTGRDKYIASGESAVGRLRGLAEELARMGYRDCIYKGAKPDYPCTVCTVPNELWRRENCPAWGLSFDSSDAAHR